MNGKVLYDAKKRQWRIAAAPHVAIRLKRVFGKINTKAFGVITLSDTEENARDLEWFLERYPMEVPEISRLRDRASAHKERMSLVDAMLSKTIAPPAFELALPPREYQRAAAALVLATGGLLLADDLGTGKTVSAICMLADPASLPALVVTLTHLPRQWEREINRFAPKLRTHILKKTTPYDLTSLGPKRGKQPALSAGMPDVIITSYSKLAKWAETLAPLISGRGLVFDEVQELRNAGATKKERPAKYAAASHLAKHAGTRLGMSATPIHNYGGEWYSVLNILRPKSLGTRSEFMDEWCSGISAVGDKPRIRDPKAFGAYLRESGLMLRRTREDVGRELPELTKIMHHVDCDTAALNKIGEECAELAKVILRQGGQTSRHEKLNASEQFSLRLRQATGIAKAAFVADFVKMLVESGEKVLLYAWHRAVYDIYKDRLKDCKPVMYTGSESIGQKDEARTAFISGEARVLLMSLRAGAGLDGLQGSCRTVCFGEIDWSGAVHDQGIGRVHRDGQRDPVCAYFLVAEHGSDPIVLDILGLKREQLEGVRDPNAQLIERLEVDGNRIKRLAESYLAQRGIALPTQGTAA